MKTTQSGAAIVEFALILPLLLLLTLLTTEFGRAIYQYNTVVKSVRGAARFLTVQNLPDTKFTEASNLVVYGTTTAGTTPLVPDLNTGMVTSVWSPLTGSYPPMRTVSITVTGYTFNSLFSSVFGVTFGTVAYAPISVTMRSSL